MFFLRDYPVHYTLRKNTNFKKNSLDKTNITQNALFLPSRAPTHQSFTFNSRFLYELKCKAHLSKIGVGFSIFDSVSFLVKFVFLFNKDHVLFDFKTS